jgi:hypothetical protein
MQFVTEMPSEEDSHERKHKWPFIVNEVLTADGCGLLETFFEEEAPEEEDSPLKSESSPTKSEEFHDAKDGEESEFTVETAATDAKAVADGFKEEAEQPQEAESEEEATAPSTEKLSEDAPAEVAKEPTTEEQVEEKEKELTEEKEED